MMKARESILNEINKILVEENAKAIKEDDLLISSELDSFGYAILFLTISSENNNCCENDYVNSIDFKTYKAKDLINRIIEKSKLNKCIRKKKKYKNRSKKWS